MFLKRVLLTSLIRFVFSINLSFSNVATVPICYMSNVADPLSAGTLGNAEIRRIAWPLMTAPFVVPLTINGNTPVGGPEVICMTGCQVPPCSPTYQCPPGDLWWSVAFSPGALIVSPSDLLHLPDDLVSPPPLLAFLWEFSIPTPLLQPSTIPTLTATQTIIPVQPTLTVSPFASQGVASNLSNNLSLSNILNPTTSNNSTGHDLAIAYIFVGILGLIAIFSFYCVIMLYRYTQCPYCNFIIRAGAPFLTHLNECEEHLKRFTPLTSVTSIPLQNDNEPRQNVKTPKSQLVFAPRPGPRLIVPLAAEKELLGRTRTNSNDEIVVELTTAAK